VIHHPSPGTTQTLINGDQKLPGFLPYSSSLWFLSALRQSACSLLPFCCFHPTWPIWPGGISIVFVTPFPFPLINSYHFPSYIHMSCLDPSMLDTKNLEIFWSKTTYRASQTDHQRVSPNISICLLCYLLSSSFCSSMDTLRKWFPIPDVWMKTHERAKPWFGGQRECSRQGDDFCVPWFPLGKASHTTWGSRLLQGTIPSQMSSLPSSLFGPLDSCGGTKRLTGDFNEW
jgi:hypothetical protein